MKMRELGKTGIKVSELCYGCTAQFGKDFLGKESISDDHALLLVKTALENGITFFDTGFNYGYAESRLGECLSTIFGGGGEGGGVLYKQKAVKLSIRMVHTARVIIRRIG